ncbi:4-hydroxybenzoate polyprenyltransferase, putative [Heliomicrobium modesticaldum Ice1]|uniref:4-hydroxybenzoate polyprenyltransferase n=1 Tax=Heliobacterium modesticaldum (strain ATCC 51547 / Ice1) TaxID=498761 RepID=B0TFS4_HELMI|nr:UbiA-like polyprenyltransferase [Heliomicrobium modesticaldum]ABZ84504.1 4-hydroxybenzoate polyprenyltransferase, putative [Heliomicrobium modesticaldum Ice1]
MSNSTSALGRVGTFLEMIKFEHTIFALPFAYMGALLAQIRVPDWPVLFWITMAMVGARTAAMTLNRLIDRHIDRKNPRTASRAMARGIIGVGEAWIYVALSLALLLFSAAMLNATALLLSPLALFVLVLYSYTKRFTWACHFVLGLALGAAPMGAWIGVNASVDPTVVVLAFAVLFWSAGFDVIYACQDVDFDRAQGLYSIPARFGIARGLMISRLLHVLAPLLLVTVGLMLGLGTFYYVGVAISAGLLVYEHTLVSPHDLSRLDAAFFAMNGYISMTMFLFTLLDIFF